MDEKQYYRDYIQHCYNTLIELSDALHNVYKKRNSHANILYANLNILEANNVSKSLIDNLINGNKVKNISYVKEINCSNSILSNIIRINLNQFLFITLKQIPNLLVKLKYYDWLCRIPYVIFTNILHSFNKELAKNIIKGNTVNLGTYLGNLQVVRLLHNDGIDYRASMLYYRQLVAQGLTPKTAKTPKGISWFIRKANAFNWKIKYIRKKHDIIHFANVLFYKFHKVDHNKTLDELETKYGKRNIKDIIEDNNLSIGDKLNYILHNDSDIFDKYKAVEFKLKTSKDTKSDEYIRPKLD